MKAKLQLYIEGTRIDLFDDESINIIQSIQNVKDISKIFVDFTRTFNIPASKTNNKIFQHYYNYFITNGFDARLKKDATIEINSRPFKTGKIKLNGVDLQDGEPNSYRITFFANTIDLKDLLGDDDLSSLDLTDFDTTYDATTVESALKNGLSKTYTRTDNTTINYPRGLIAPLISHTTRLYYDSSDSTDYPNASGGNLYPYGTSGANASHQGVYWQELKYAIKVDAIVKAIEDKYGLTFSSDFFNTTNEAYYGLYMWIHRKKGKVFETTPVKKQITGFLINYNQEIPEVTSYGDRFVVQNVPNGGYLEYSLDVNSTTSISGTISIYKNGTELYDQKTITTGFRNLSGTLGNGTYTIFITSEASSFVLDTNTNLSLNPSYYPSGSGAEYALQSNYTFNNTRQFIISQQIPEMKVIDFLTGIFKMFNLTAYNSNGTIIIKTLNEYYNDSDVVWDITNYVDTTESTVDVALPYKEVEFKYEGLETKLAKQHEQLSNLSWATEEYRGSDYYDANPETYVVNLPFEHMKYERLYDVNTAKTIQVGWFVDDNNSAYFGKPLLFYTKKQSSADTIRFLITENAGSPDVSGTNYNDISTYHIPSNSFDIDPNENEININFRNELNEYTNTNEFTDTLFKVYYQNYISQVFSNDRRLTTLNAYLPIKMLQELNLADTVAILDRNYSINEIETDFSTGRSKLELINELTVSVGGSAPSTTTTTTIDPNICYECTADSTFCTVDGLTPTADATCDIERSLTITGNTEVQQGQNVTLTATALGFDGTATYLWSDNGQGNSDGLTTAQITVTNNTSQTVTYTCTATDSSDSAEFSDTHDVFYTPIVREVVISGPTTKEQTVNITLTTEVFNVIGTASYLWSGGEAQGLTTSSVTISNDNTGNVTYTCTVTDDFDNEQFSDSHVVLWTPKVYVITLNVVNNISGDAAGYNITGNQTGDKLSLQTGQIYSFNTNVSPNNGYQFTTGPDIQNAQGTVGTNNITVNTTLSGTVQLTDDFITIGGATQKTTNNTLVLSAFAQGFTPTSYTWSGGALQGSGTTYCVNPSDCYQVSFTETTAGTRTYTVEATDGTITASDTHTVIWSTVVLIDITLSIDTSNITGPTAGYKVIGDQDGLVKTQASGTVFNFNSDVELNSGYEWVGSKPSVDNAGGTYTTSQTVTTTFGSGEVELIVYNYYQVTGCPDTSVESQTRYIRSRDTFTVGSTTTASYIKIDGQCYYTNATAFETDWATNNGVTVGAPEGTGCTTCTGVVETVDTCLETKSIAYLRYSSSNNVCESEQSKSFYYIDGVNIDPMTQSAFCAATELYNYVGPTTTGVCSASFAAAGYYSLDSDNTKRRYWNGTSFSVCTTCIDANGLYYLGQGFNPLIDYCDEGGVFGYYYFDNNKTLTSATSADHMYTSAANVGTANRAPEGFYTDLVNYRYYEPQSLQVWENADLCPSKPEPPACTAPTKPTLTVWRQYTDCLTGLDSTIIFGNNTDSFPSVVEYNGECYSNPQFAAGNQDNRWIDAQTCVNDKLVYDYPRFNNCNDCTGDYYYDLKKCTDNTFGYRTGQTTTAITLPTNRRVQAGGIDYIVVGITQTGTSLGTVTDTGETGCPIIVPDDNVFVVERQSDSFVTYVQLDAGYQVGDIFITISTDGTNCYDIQGTDYVETPTNYGTITGSCTTTTTTTTTTTISCGSQVMYASAIDAETVCCNTTKTGTVYMDSNDISTATAIYTDNTCTALYGSDRYLSVDFGNYYYWNSSTNTLSGPTTCPACQ